MTVPSRAEAARLLLSLDPPAWHLRHSRAVAEVAGWLARRIAERGPFDRDLVEAAALLHDVDKVLPRGSRPAGLPHGVAGAGWLAALAHGELSEAVSLHPVTRLADAGDWSRLQDASLATRVVAYADKRAQQRLVPMAARFERWERRHPDGWSADLRAAVWGRARSLEDEVCERARCRPAEVERLGWTAAAFRTAQAAPRTAPAAPRTAHATVRRAPRASAEVSP